MSDNWHNLDSIFNPSSIAIAGVAPEGQGRFATGNLFLDYILRFGFRGSVYPLHPRGGEVSGLKVYANVKDVPGPVDYVLSCIPATLVPQLILDCADKGVKGVALFTAGFSETGKARGRNLEDEVHCLAEATGIRVIGPNCMGVYSPKAGLAFATDLPRESGRVGLLCQSGVNSIYLIRAAGERGIRFSKAVSYGNACDVNESDLLEYFLQDDETDMVAGYVEGVRDGIRFRNALRELATVKPVAILRGGVTQRGAVMAASHTGSLAGSDKVWDALLEQTGAARVHTLDELVDAMVACTFMRIPAGRRAVVFGLGGGPTVLASDECSAAGFALPDLPAEIQEDMRRTYGTDAGIMLSNPIDFAPTFGGNQVEYRRLLTTLFAWEGFDLLILQLPLGGIMLDVPMAQGMLGSLIDNVIEVAGGSTKPVAVVLHNLATSERHQVAAEFRRKCCQCGVPVFASVASAVRSAGRLLEAKARCSGLRR